MRYDVEERVLFAIAKLTGKSIDSLYQSAFVRFMMNLSARAGGSSVKRPR